MHRVTGFILRSLATATASIMHRNHQSSWLTTRGGSALLKPALVLVNSPSADIASLIKLWGSEGGSPFGLVVCADGGANRLFDTLSPQLRASYLPQYIVGDLDSLREETAMFYRNHGTTVIQDLNQDNNDLEKCLNLIEGLSKTQMGSSSVEGSPTEETEVIVYGAFGGRFDQQMAAVHCLFRFQESSRLGKIVLVGDGNLCFLLQPHAQHTINLSRKEGPGCALLPIGCKSDSVTTSGLEWNLAGQSLEFGQLVSTSNRVLTKPSNDHHKQQKGEYAPKSDPDSDAPDGDRGRGRGRDGEGEGDKDEGGPYEPVQISSSQPLVWMVELSI